MFAVGSLIPGIYEHQHQVNDTRISCDRLVLWLAFLYIVLVYLHGACLIPGNRAALW